MATSTCIKCGNNTFELKKNQPTHSNVPIWFIQCGNCGGVIGAMSTTDIGYFVEKIAAKLDVR